MIRRVVAGISAAVAALGMIVGTASAAQSLGGRTIDAKEPYQLRYNYVDASYSVVGKSGAQTVYMRFLRNGSVYGSTISVPLVSGRYYSGTSTVYGPNCNGTGKSTWVFQIKFASSPTWDSSAGKSITCF